MKDPIIYKANVIFQRACTCKEFYVGKTKCNQEVRWKEHCILNNTYRKNCFTQFSTIILSYRSWATSYLFPMFAQLISVHSIFIYKECRCLKNVIHQLRQKWIVASFSISSRFTSKFELVFVLIQEYAFSQRFYFKTNRKGIDFSKKQFQGF